jgi:hypothetical protein
MMNIPVAAVAGWTANNIGGLSESGCEGINVTQFNHIPVSVYGGFTSVCIAALSPSLFSSISSTQFKYLYK